VDDDDSVSMGKAKNPLGYRAVLNSLDIMNTAHAASMGVSRRGNARSPVNFGGVLQRVKA